MEKFKLINSSRNSIFLLLIIFFSLSFNIVLKSQVSKTVNVAAGNLSTKLSVTEKNTITNLTLTGTIDARDFKTIRDSIPLLNELDLSETTILAYNGSQGTSFWGGNVNYLANALPEFAFFKEIWKYKRSFTSFILPTTATSIGNHAFFNCFFHSVTIHSLVTSIDVDAFHIFSGSINVDASNPNFSSVDGVLFNKDKTQLIKCPISKSGIYVIPSSVKSIMRNAFDHCTFTSTIIPSSVTTIEAEAFDGSTGDKIVEVNNPNYSSLDGVLYNKTQSILVHCPTSKTGVFTIPSTVTSTNYNSFWECKGLSSILFPWSLTTIENQSFYGCSGLTSILFPPLVNSIGGNTFAGCTGLTSFIFPPLVTTISFYTFQNCSGLKSIIIPSSIKSISSFAFSGCTALSSIYANCIVPINLTSSSNVFNSVNKTTCKLYVPFGSKSVYQAANQWQDFMNIIEMSGINLSATALNIGHTEGSSVWINISSNINWTAVSDQSWLSVNPESDINNGIITFTATANNNLVSRTATVTVSADGVESKTVLVTQNSNELACPQHFHTVWEGTSGADHMNISVLDAKMDGVDLEPGDEIGVFDGNLCVGFGKVFKTIDQQNILNIIVSKNDGSGNGFTAGNEVSYKFWDCSAETEIIVNDVQCFIQLNPITCLPFAALATSFVRLSAIIDICQTLQLSAGWNIFSVPSTLEPADIVNNFQPIITNNSLVKIQEEGGHSLEDWGIYGGWQNYIGDISPTEGYKIKLSKNDLLEVCGAPVKYPFAIPLKSGWNLIGFPHSIAFDGLSVLHQLMDSKTLVKVQDEGGHSIEDWGIYGGWQNYIGDFIPGEGYKLKVNADDTLWITESYPKSSAFLPEVVATTHFKKVFEGNGIDHMNMYMVGLPVNILQACDELAIFDGSTCVGAITILPCHLQSQTASIAASAKDKQGMPGFAEGNQMTLKLWNSKQNREIILEPEIVNGTSTFAKHESMVASMEKYITTGLEGTAGFDLPEINCYPNPFSNKITIEIKLVQDSEVLVEVLDQLGQRVKFLQTEKLLNSGVHRLMWDGKSTDNQQVSTGIYHLRITLNDNVLMRKMVYSK